MEKLSTLSGMTNSLQRIASILMKELRQLSRDRATFAMIVIIPLIELLLFGFAINTDVREIPVTAVDNSRTYFSRALMDALEATQVIRIVRQDARPQGAEEALKSGKVRAALIIPSDFIQRLNDGRTGAQWLIDGSDPMISSAILKLQTMPFRATAGIQPESSGALFKIVLYYNPEQRSVVNIVPGLVGVILTMTMIMFTSAALVRERERGNLELLIATPVHPIELMIGKIIPYIFVGFIQTGIIMSLGHLIFDVPFVGSIIQMLLATMLFISASLTLGLIISTIAETQLQASQMTIFILLPSILLSGFMFPFEGMPIAAQWLSELLPATHYMRLMRGIILRGAELQGMTTDAVYLGAFTIGGLVVAAKRFKKSLD
ncbi:MULTISPECIES: ABC transporter permease [unclassified Endozoicomonas]|uniref:ABC transporter permease n=1 Tax=unclassified Endozoicomonas TaxID=2644528 RepID=UPI00214732FC|nr:MULTISPECIES: ABC transporter permease [unclassified Endozoicomonas]